MKLGDRVVIRYPGHALHGSVGTVLVARETPDFGMLYIVRVTGGEPSEAHDVALPARCLRAVSAKAGAG